MIALLRPLVSKWLVPTSWPIVVSAVSGYTGGGKAMIAEFEDEASETYSEDNHRIYAMGQKHKHPPEMKKYSRLEHAPVFMPSVGRYAQGMIVEIGLPLWAIPGKPRRAQIHAALTSAYQGERFVSVASLADCDALKAYLYGEGLLAPAQVDLPVPNTSSIAGVCSGPMRAAGIMRVAYWTSTNDRVLQTGIVREENGEFSWDASESTFTDFGIRSCAYTSDTLVASPRAKSAASLTRGDFDALLSIEDGSGLQVSTDLGMTNTEITVRDGITVIAPDAPDAMAAMGTMMSGGYPGGVIVIAGETAPDQHQAVFVDPSPLTMDDSR